MSRGSALSRSLLSLMLVAAVAEVACGAGDDTSAPPTAGSATGATMTSTASTGTAAGGTATTGASTGAGGTAGVGATSGGGSAGTSTTGAGGNAGTGGRSTGGNGTDAGRGGAGIGGSNGGIDAGNLVDQLLALTQGCAKIVSSHTYKLDNGQAVNICGLNGAIYFTADMDIDCDGRNIGDGKCPGNDCCYQPDTAFHNNAGQPLAASVTPYVVIPNDFHIAGLAGGNVVAVIYNRQLEFAVFGDTGPIDIIGEASYACAAGLGINPDPGNGGIGSGVTYIAFTGTGAKPADIENQSQTATLGQQLAQMLLQSNP